MNTFIVKRKKHLQRLMPLKFSRGNHEHSLSGSIFIPKQIIIRALKKKISPTQVRRNKTDSDLHLARKWQHSHHAFFRRAVCRDGPTCVCSWKRPKPDETPTRGVGFNHDISGQTADKTHGCAGGWILLQRASRNTNALVRLRG